MTDSQEVDTEILYREVEVAAKAKHDSEGNFFGSWEDQPQSYKQRMRQSVLPVATAVVREVRSNSASPIVNKLDADVLLNFNNTAAALRIAVAVIDGDLPREDFDDDAADGVRIARDIAVDLRDKRVEQARLALPTHE